MLSQPPTATTRDIENKKIQIQMLNRNRNSEQYIKCDALVPQRNVY